MLLLACRIHHCLEPLAVHKEAMEHELQRVTALLSLCSIGRGVRVTTVITLILRDAGVL